MDQKKSPITLTIHKASDIYAAMDKLRAHGGSAYVDRKNSAMARVLLQEILQSKLDRLERGEPERRHARITTVTLLGDDPDASNSPQLHSPAARTQHVYSKKE
jgi:hypothetical protein